VGCGWGGVGGGIEGGGVGAGGRSINYNGYHVDNGMARC
jgi:hypothetical protein